MQHLILRFVKRELKLEQDVVSLDILTEVDVLGDGDQEEDEDVNDEDDESDEEDMDEEEEIEEDEDIEMDKEANAWVGNENELLHIKFNSNQEADNEVEEDQEEEEDMKDVKLKVEEEDVRLSIPIEDGEVACKGEVHMINKYFLFVQNIYICQRFLLCVRNYNHFPQGCA